MTGICCTLSPITHWSKRERGDEWVNEKLDQICVTTTAILKPQAIPAAYQSSTKAKQRTDLSFSFNIETQALADLSGLLIWFQRFGQLSLQYLPEKHCHCVVRLSCVVMKCK